MLAKPGMVAKLSVDYSRGKLLRRRDQWCSGCRWIWHSNVDQVICQRQQNETINNLTDSGAYFGGTYPRLDTHVGHRWLGLKPVR